MADSPLYGYHEIQRYLQRRMSPQEMHAFEKALMDDPFLADAMEGFAAGDPALSEVHLDSIEEKIQGLKEKTKVVPLATGRTHWWKAAAIVLVIISGGALSYSWLHTREERVTLAQEKKAGMPAADAMQADSITFSQRPPVKHEEPSTEIMPGARQNPAPQKPSSRAASGPSIVSSRKRERPDTALAGRIAGLQVMDSSVSPQDLTVPAAPMMKSMRQVPGQALNEIRGQVTDIRGGPVAYATIINNDTHEGAVSDAQGYFTLKVTDSIASVTINSLNYSPSKATLSNRQRMNSVLLEENAQPLAEVVVGYGRMMKKYASLPDSSGQAEPVGGWKNFGQYLNRKVDSLQTKDGGNVYSNQNVVLEFFIDEDGNPARIKVKERVSREVADKAVEILSAGPKWKKNKKDRKVKVVIPFGSTK